MGKERYKIHYAEFENKDAYLNITKENYCNNIDVVHTISSKEYKSFNEAVDLELENFNLNDFNSEYNQLTLESEDKFIEATVVKLVYPNTFNNMYPITFAKNLFMKTAFLEE